MWIIALLGFGFLIYLASTVETKPVEDHTQTDCSSDPTKIDLHQEDLQNLDYYSGKPKDQLISSMLIGGMLEEESDSGRSGDGEIDLFGGGSDSGGYGDDSSGSDGF